MVEVQFKVPHPPIPHIFPFVHRVDRHGTAAVMLQLSQLEGEEKKKKNNPRTIPRSDMP